LDDTADHEADACKIDLPSDGREPAWSLLLADAIKCGSRYLIPTK
jgi:hypothetical protein